MSILDAVMVVLRELPPAVRGYVDKRIRWEFLPRPTAAHLELGAAPGDQGLFAGFPVRGDDDDQGGEMYDHGDGVGHAQGEPELRASDDDDTAELVTHEPGGTIYLYTENIRPLDREHLRRAVLHELAHFFGEDEDGVFELGLA
jgi:hypothetical protein